MLHANLFLQSVLFLFFYFLIGQTRVSPIPFSSRELHDFDFSLDDHLMRTLSSYLHSRVTYFPALTGRCSTPQARLSGDFPNSNARREENANATQSLCSAAIAILRLTQPKLIHRCGAPNLSGYNLMPRGHGCSTATSATHLTPTH